MEVSTLEDFSKQQVMNGMKKYTDIDRNFKIVSTINRPDIKFYDVKTAPFSIHGMEYANGKFRRMPEDIAKKVSDGVHYFHANTAGGRVRFKTDSPYLAINVEYTDSKEFADFTFLGSVYFDVYIKICEKEVFFKSFSAPLSTLIENYKRFEQAFDFGVEGVKEITINFPTYCEINEFYIGLSEKSTVCEASPYKYEKPIVYYGSSITQGACCSRPGNTYPSMISRRFNADFMNLGFSGSARGEIAMAEYIKGLPMLAFIYDYDFNAPTDEYLNETHERMYRIIREANPDIPIIIIGRPKYDFPRERFEIIKNTYDTAKQCGENVYLLNGEQLMALCGEDGLLDGCHPNDFGFASIAKAVGDVLEDILKAI